MPAIAAGFGSLALGTPVALVLFGQSFTRRSDNRLIIAEGNDSTAVAAASEALAEQKESYRRTKRQRAKAGCDGWQGD